MSSAVFYPIPDCEATELRRSPELAAHADRTRRQANRLTALGFVLVTIAQVWVISAGWMTYWPQYTTHYNRLAEAFRRGQCSLLFRPDPAHLALADPYDPVTNEKYRLRAGVHDTVLYDGKFFLCWGPVPALMLMPVKAAIGRVVVGDQYLVFAFTFGAMAFTTLLLRSLWGRYFSDVPPWMLFLAILVAGLSTPLPYTLARSAVYEAAILGGQCFLLGGLYFVCGFRQFPGRLRLALAGTCWGLAAGCRVSLAIALAGLSLLVVWRVVRRRWEAREEALGLAVAPQGHSVRCPASSAQRTECPCGTTANRGLLQCSAITSEGNRRAGIGDVVGRIDWLSLAAFATPLAVAAILLGAYNIARFGNWHEFGQRYQLTNNQNYHSIQRLFQPANAIPGFYSYFMRPIQLHGDFPYLEAVPGAGRFPAFIPIPQNYEFNEPIAGLFIVTPFIWLALIPIRGLLQGVQQAGLAWILCCLLAASLLGFAPIPFMLGSTMRYLCDLTPCLMILASVGLWQRARETAGGPAMSRRVFRSVAFVLAAWSITIGMLLSVTGYYQHFFHFHRHLFGHVSYWAKQFGE